MTQPRPQFTPPLAESLQDYSDWLLALDPPAGAWEQVLVVDHLQRDRPVCPVPPGAFVERWNEIVTSVVRNWVKLEFVGCHRGVLVIGVDWRPPAEGDEVPPAHPIWVNWSGPSQLTRMGVCCRAVSLPWAGTSGPDYFEMYCPYCSNENPAAASLTASIKGLRISFTAQADAERAVESHLMAHHPYWAGRPIAH